MLKKDVLIWLYFIRSYNTDIVIVFQGVDGVSLMMKWKQDIRVKAMIALTNTAADFTIQNYTVLAEKEVRNIRLHYNQCVPRKVYKSK